MCVRFRIVVLSAFQLGVASAAEAQTTLTLGDVLSRARERAPQIVSARLTLDETRARLRGASVRLQSNPELEMSAGNRQGTDQRTTDVELGLSQMFEPRARRAARIASAQAAIAVSTAQVDEAARTVLHAAATAYYRAVHAAERSRLLMAAQVLAGAVYSAADRRFKSGDIAVLDVNIARAALARVRADREGAEASGTVATGELKRLLRIDGEISVQGDLAMADDVDLGARFEAASRRPELRALEAQISEAEAVRQVGLSFSKPDYGFGVKYAREEGDQLLLGGFKLTLPVFSKGQELQAGGLARVTRLQAELDAARQRVRLEVRAAFDVYRRRLEAVRVLQTEALPRLDENDALTTRSFEVGQIGLTDLLLLRREILDTRFQYLDALLEAALARINLDAVSAVLQ
jgi:outer membrane protein, heavy metal efflux system